MLSPPFTVGLRISVEVARLTAQPQDPDTLGTWRDRLDPVGELELISRRHAADSVPTPDEARDELTETFAEHPMVNVGAVGPPPRSPARGWAYVIAEVVLLPDLSPIPPGGEAPDVTGGEVGEPVVVHRALWPHQPGTEDEHLAAELLLHEIAAGMPVELWRRDG